MARNLHVLLCIVLLTSYALKAECKTSLHSREDNLADNNDGTVEFYVEETNTKDEETRVPFPVENTEEETDAINRENIKPVYVEEPADIIGEETVELQDSFQGCMVACIKPEICCSCKESGKRSMVVALVNQLTKDCATSNLTTCANQWVERNIEFTKKAGASSCTRSEMIVSNVQLCANKCLGRPLSKPLNPKNPNFNPGYLTNFADLSHPPSVDLTDFCKDMRAEGLLCTKYRADSFTAGNTLCRSDNRCGYHDQQYSWCYVDFSNNWDYCCTETCDFHGQNYLWCKSGSGSKWQYCGKGGDMDIKHHRCVANYPCGVHQEIGKKSYYWCYKDLNKNWDYCCQPWHSCGKHGRAYNWCYTGYTRDSSMQKCTP